MSTGGGQAGTAGTARRASPGPVAGVATDPFTLRELLDASPEVPARTSVAAILALAAAATALVASPWSFNLGLVVLLCAAGLLLGTVGLAMGSRPGVAGGAAAAAALVVSLLVAALVGLRYLGVDTAVADGTSLRPALEALTALLPTP